MGRELCLWQHVAGHKASQPSPWPSCKFGPLFLCSSGFSCGLRVHRTPAVAALLTCPSAPCAPMLAYTVLQFSSLVLPGQLPISSLLGVHGNSVSLFSTLLSPMHPGGTKPMELCALARIPLAVMLCLAGVLCAMVCPLHLSPMEISAAQHRAEELVLPQALWQRPAISICIMETVAQPPSTHSGLFLGLAVLMRER